MLISVLKASFLLVVLVMSLIHSKINGNKSPKYGLIDSALILLISLITFKIADTKVEVARSPSSFLIKHNKIDVE